MTTQQHRHVWQDHDVYGHECIECGKHSTECVVVNPGHLEGLKNLRNVRRFFEAHLCATQAECAKALGLSVMAVNRHVRAIRSEWRDSKEVGTK